MNPNDYQMLSLKVKMLTRLQVGLMTMFFLTGCQSYAPIKTAGYVDLDRFSGDWYVIATIPTFLERNAYGAIESYERPKNGRIATTFSFYEGGFEGEFKQFSPTGFVANDGSNAVWGMQFVWPIKAEYRVLYIDDRYETAIIGRSKRDYVWIMARRATLSSDNYQTLVDLVESSGYDITKLRKVPQKASNDP